MKMEPDNVRDCIRKLLMVQIRNLDLQLELQDDTRLIDDLHLDSVTYIGLVISLEEMLHIRFDEDHLTMQKLTSLLDLYRYVEAKTPQGQTDNNYRE